MTRKRYTNTPPTNGKHLYLSREERFARFGRVVGEATWLPVDATFECCGYHVCSCARSRGVLVSEAASAPDSSQAPESSAIDFEHNGQPFRAKRAGDNEWLVMRRPDTGNCYVILVWGEPSHVMLHYAAKGYIECHGDDRARVKSAPAPPAKADLPPLPAGFEWYVAEAEYVYACDESGRQLTFRSPNDGRWLTRAPHPSLERYPTVYDALAAALGLDSYDLCRCREGWVFGDEHYFFHGQRVKEEALTSSTTRGMMLELEARVLAAESEASVNPMPNLPPLPAGMEWSRYGRYVISELRELVCLWGDGQYWSVHGFGVKSRSTVYDAIVDALGADASAMFCDRDGWTFGGDRHFFRGQPVNEEALTSATTRGRLLEHEARVLAAERAE